MAVEGTAPELLRRGMAGDAAAIRALVDLLAPVIQARVARLLLRGRWRGDLRHEVEDLSQDVFVALFADSGRILLAWDPERGLSLLNFVGLVAERQAISVLRTGRAAPLADDPTLCAQVEDGRDTEPNPEVRTASRELLGAVLDRLRERLSPLGLCLFQTLLVEEQSVDAVCAETGMTADAIYAWRSRLKKVVRELVAELTKEPAPQAMRVVPGGRL